MFTTVIFTNDSFIKLEFLQEVSCRRKKCQQQKWKFYLKYKIQSGIHSVLADCLNWESGNMFCKCFCLLTRFSFQTEFRVKTNILLTWFNNKSRHPLRHFFFKVLNTILQYNHIVLPYTNVKSGSCYSLPILMQLTKQNYAVRT